MTQEEALTLLGLEPGATRTDIIAAHRELAQMLHPDKFGENQTLRRRAESQMKSINQARDVLMGKTAEQRRSYQAQSIPVDSPEHIAHEADIRANAAEAARIQLGIQTITLKERRGGYVSMVAVAFVALLVSRFLRGTVGGLILSIASALVVWGIVDIVTISGQIKVLDSRARELVRTRDRARDISRRAREL